MNDTHEQSHDAGPEDRFDARRLRSITDVRRSTDDRMVAGVCTGAGRYLGIDPVVLRVILAALTFVGLAGLILYLAAWLLLPEDDGTPSYAAQWFKLDENEEQVRIVGLIVAGLAAIGLGTGIWGGDWAGPFPWIGLIVLGAVYLLIIRPVQGRRRDAQQEATTAAAAAPFADVTTTVDADGPAAPPAAPLVPKPPRRRKSPALTLLTLCVALITCGIVAISKDDLPWTTYGVIVLGVIGVGLLVGTFLGDGGVLIGLGVVLAIVLAAASLLPNARIGQDVFAPTTASAVESRYQLGVGETVLDLTDVADPSALEGRTVKVETGIGHTEVIVPEGLDVTVDAYVRAGDIRVFERQSDGTAARLHDESLETPALTLDIKQTFGQIEVVRR